MSGGDARAAETRVRVLCVDDEPNVLEGLALNLRRRYEVSLATSGAAGLEVLGKDATIAVVISDMRMPNMNGATFLSLAKEVAPDATRMLLTGQADLESAIAAVNEGQIFRFLTKPCPPSVLLKALEAAAEQHRLITSERVLLEQTLHGSIKALADVLALTSPLSFGRANRIKQLVSDIARHLGLRERWQVEVAAMLSQLGSITLPPDTAEKVYYGHVLTIDEQRMVSRMSGVTEQLLASIPRLELVREILTRSAGSPVSVGGDETSSAQAQVAAQILRVAIDYDALEVQGHSVNAALKTLKGRVGRYDVTILGALEALRGTSSEPQAACDVALCDLEVGMVVVEDVKLLTGALLVARGYEVTAGFVARAANFRDVVARPTVRVVVRTSEHTRSVA